jgi:threonine/homoserine/homoserine lactone efflux protein
MRLATLPSRVARRLASVKAEQWLHLILALLLIGFLVTLVIEPGSVGRGGR